MAISSGILDKPRVNHVTRTAFVEAQMQFDRAAERLKLDAATRQLLRSPMQEHQVTMVLQKLDSWLTAAFAAVCGMSEREQVSLRDAAYLIAVDRTARACRDRGWV